ncbi:MAG TPA: sigma-54 dependent transcriptional regulator [Acidobacteriota bacterium]|jgi:DNA-binding NtrC family response regulator
MDKKRILFVDDDAEMRSLVSEFLQSERYVVTLAENGKDALDKIMNFDFDAVVTDLRMKEMDGLSLLNQIHSENPLLPVILITAFGSIETAVEAIKEGATNFVPKPFKMQTLKAIVDKAIEQKRMMEENRYLKEELGEKYSFHNIIGKSKEMQLIFQLIRQIASSQSNVLIEGESGTGKELVARALHYNSNRSQRQFVAINCSALPETLLESELFGYAKGAFTDAKTSKQGLFEVADGGTLFLDEISSMPLSLQAKILRVLQDGEIRPLGHTVSRKVDVRIISATNKDLESGIEDGTFREDLYYRLNVISIVLPPLRKRREDIPILAQHFLKHFAEINGKNIRGFEPSAMSFLMNVPWKGNVRELENTIERAAVLSRSDVISMQELIPMTKKGKASKFDFGDTLLPLAEIERMYTEKVLNAVDGKIERAARILGVSSRTLYRRNKKNHHAENAFEDLTESVVE